MGWFACVGVMIPEWMRALVCCGFVLLMLGSMVAVAFVGVLRVGVGFWLVSSVITVNSVVHFRFRL